MLDKLLRFYKDSHSRWFEFGNGFICGTDYVTFITIRDERFQGFPDGNINTPNLKQLAKADSFGYESGSIWIENGGKKEFIKIDTGLLLNSKISAKASGKPKFESNRLVKAIRKIKVSDACYVGFEGSRAKIFDLDWNTVCEIEVPTQFEQRILYEWELLKKGIKMKNTYPMFSIIEIREGVYALRLCWDDLDVYVGNYTGSVNGCY